MEVWGTDATRRSDFDDLEFEQTKVESNGEITITPKYGSLKKHNIVGNIELYNLRPDTMANYNKYHNTSTANTVNSHDNDLADINIGTSLRAGVSEPSSTWYKLSEGPLVASQTIDFVGGAGCIQAITGEIIHVDGGVHAIGGSMLPDK